MKHKFAQFRIVAVTSLILLLALAACSQSSGGQNATPPASDDQPTAAASPEQPTLEQPTQAPAKVTIDASDPCSVFTKEQIEAAFGKSVQEVVPKQKSGDSGCQYVLDDRAKGAFSVSTENIIDVSAAINHYAVMITAAGQGCMEWAKYSIKAPPLKEVYPAADQSLLILPLIDLYRQYYDEAESKCYVSHYQDLHDVGTNAIAHESVIFFGASEVKIFGDKDIVSFTYIEALPNDLNQAFNNSVFGNEEKSREYRTLGATYIEQVLSNYTEIIVGLVKQVAGK